MNKKLLAFVVLLVAGICAAPFVYAQVIDNQVARGYNRQACSGTHCFFAATWMERTATEMYVIDAILNMDTFIWGPTETVAPGDTFTIDIDASGEIIGNAGRFYDSPPITFERNGVVKAVTAGLDNCQFQPGSIGYGDQCRSLTSSQQPDIFGTWQDTWTANGISCTTQADGTKATCNVSPTASGAIRVDVARKVDSFKWHNNEVVATWWRARWNEPNPFGLRNPFPGTMKASTTITVTGANPSTTPTSTPLPACSDTQDNDGDTLIDRADPGCHSDGDPNDGDDTYVPTHTSESNIPQATTGGIKENE